MKAVEYSGGKSSNIQAPSTREAPSPNSQTSAGQVLGLRPWSFSEAWMLVLGSSASRCLISVLLWLLLFSQCSYADYSTTINPQTTWGTWEGWGTSLCWWANVFGNR